MRVNEISFSHPKNQVLILQRARILKNMCSGAKPVSRDHALYNSVGMKCWEEIEVAGWLPGTARQADETF